jgi:hypothetical protein
MNKATCTSKPTPPNFRTKTHDWQGRGMSKDRIATRSPKQSKTTAANDSNSTYSRQKHM